MEREDLLRTLHENAIELRDMLAAPTWDWLLAVCSDSAESASIDKRTTSEEFDLFEFILYFFIARHLSRSAALNLRLVRPSSGAFRLTWKRGSKANFVFFRLVHNGVTYDLCHGTGVTAPSISKTQYPDVSLQRMSALVAPPDPGEPVAIWDAKFHQPPHSTPEKAPTYGESDFDAVNRMCDVLGPFSIVEDDVLSALMPSLLGVSALVTNASKGYMIAEVCLQKGFSVVTEFDTRQGAGPTPSRAEHLNCREGGA